MVWRWVHGDEAGMTQIANSERRIAKAGERARTPSFCALCYSTFILCLSCGCQSMYFLTPEKGKPVKAEYTKIGTQKVAVVVWADRPTLDIDPRARRRVGDAIVYDMKK